MIPRDLLKATLGKAPSILTYGAAGLKKTNSIHTLPAPIRLFDVGEGGIASVAPWIRRRREWNETKWLEFDDADRQLAIDLLRQEIRETVRIKPAPYIDVVHYDNLDAEAWTTLVHDIGSFPFDQYNSLAADSLQELSVSTQSHAKGKGNEVSALMNDIPFSWVGAQERAAMALRSIRNFGDQGIVVYTTAGEDISKEYVKNPMEKGNKGAEPFSVRGTVEAPGKLASAAPHLPDVIFHAKIVNAAIKWVCEPEPIVGGSGAWWDGKDRYGRLDKYCEPNFRTIFTQLYGKEGMEAIYASGRK